MSDKRLKVTDKRMFTPGGELREEFSYLEQENSESTAAASEQAGRPDGAAGEGVQPIQDARGHAAPEPTGPSQPQDADVDPGADPDALELPLGGARRAGFGDLVAMLAEPAAIYLGQAPLPDGTVQEDLELARLHIDLLEVLREKTAGNLDAREATYLENLLYQVRMLYVQKRG